MSNVLPCPQGYEVWQAHGQWVTEHQPMFGPGIKERFEMASKITEEQVWVAATLLARCMDMSSSACMVRVPCGNKATLIVVMCTHAFSMPQQHICPHLCLTAGSSWPCTAAAHHTAHAGPAGRGWRTSPTQHPRPCPPVRYTWPHHGCMAHTPHQPHIHCRPSGTATGGAWILWTNAKVCAWVRVCMERVTLCGHVVWVCRVAWLCFRWCL